MSRRLELLMMPSASGPAIAASSRSMLLPSLSTPATPDSPADSASSQKISASAASAAAAAARASGRTQTMRVAVAIAGIRSSYMRSPPRSMITCR